ncbi:DnaJ C-terminal domain-containing protein [Kitasatospora sp. NPDC048298]|uniref:DnaJ C-terminal domain-containing protein n=1 Tax=Kitasatospora sp. NPDC048298 TaxID=3364049 RepID=UPI003722C963
MTSRSQSRGSIPSLLKFRRRSLPTAQSVSNTQVGTAGAASRRATTTSPANAAPGRLPRTRQPGRTSARQEPRRPPQDAHQARTAINEIGDRYYGRHAPRRGKDYPTEVTLSREEARNGTIVPLRVSSRTTCPDCAGSPKYQDQGWCPMCRGSGHVPARVREHQVRFPAGLREGQCVRLRGLGERGTNGGENGDLYVTVHIEP